MGISHFPSGRSVEQLRNDAKHLAKQFGIPHMRALDIIAHQNGSSRPWHQAMRLASECRNLAEFVAKDRLGSPLSTAELFELDELEREEKNRIFLCDHSVLTISYCGEVVRFFPGDELEAIEEGFIGIFQGERVKASWNMDDWYYVCDNVLLSDCYWESYCVWLCRDGSGIYHRGSADWWDILTPEDPLGAENIYPEVAVAVTQRILKLYRGITSHP